MKSGSDWVFRWASRLTAPVNDGKNAKYSRPLFEKVRWTTRKQQEPLWRTGITIVPPLPVLATFKWIVKQLTHLPATWMILKDRHHWGVALNIGSLKINKKDQTTGFQFASVFFQQKKKKKKKVFSHSIEEIALAPSTNKKKWKTSPD